MAAEVFDEHGQKSLQWTSSDTLLNDPARFHSYVCADMLVKVQYVGKKHKKFLHNAAETTAATVSMT